MVPFFPLSFIVFALILLKLANCTRPEIRPQPMGKRYNLVATFNKNQVQFLLQYTCWFEHILLIKNKIFPSKIQGYFGRRGRKSVRAGRWEKGYNILFSRLIQP